jgi:hypothetical protein
MKLLDVKPLKARTLALSFSDDSQGVFDGAAYLATRQEPLRDPAYFNRCFGDAGALCWPSGLELSAARLHGLVNAAQTA